MAAGVFLAMFSEIEVVWEILVRFGSGEWGGEVWVGAGFEVDIFISIFWEFVDEGRDELRRFASELARTNLKV